MGFAGEHPCRWVAVRHGASKAGNDHVHVVVSLVHEDGRKANVWNDRPRAQEACGELERRHGLRVLESRAARRGGARGHKPGERASAQRRGSDELARERLARVARACAAAAVDEAEFVRRVRRAGVRVRPRYAAGRDDVVAGYSAALRPPAGQAPVWYGGGHLARDLTLPRLREPWPDTPEAAQAAVAEWGAARRNRRVVAAGREQHEPDPELWARYSDELAQLREQLRAVPADDVATWAHVARETAGAFAAWSLRVEPTPGPLEHHGVMVAQLLAHIDALDAAIANLSDRIAAVLTPHEELLELLCTIPGIHVHAAQVLIAECGLDMTRFRPSSTSPHGPERAPATMNQLAAAAPDARVRGRAG